MKLFIVRHGDKESDEFEANLTSFGEKQAKKISDILKNNAVKKVYSSANPRSIQTGSIISHELAVPFQIVDLIRELPRGVFFVSESEWSRKNSEIITNIKEFISKVEEDGEDVVLSMNAGINRVIFSTLLRIPLWKTILFTQEIACLNILEFKEIYGKKKWCVGLLNSTYHLQ